MTDTSVVGSYNPANLSTRDRIRTMVADTGPEFLLADVTIDQMITESTDWRIACANVADALASIYTRRISSLSTGGNFSASWVNRPADLRSLANRLRTEVAKDEAANRPPTYYRSVKMTRDGVDEASEYRSRPY